MSLKHQLHHQTTKLKTIPFTHFIKSKRVVVVGPDTALKGLNLGAWIDSHDIVIRFNTVFEYLPLTPELSQDYGSRTDILYLAPTPIKNYSKAPRKTLSKFKANKIQYLAYQNGNRHNHYLTGPYCFPKELEIFTKNAPKYHFKCHYSHSNTKLLTKILTKMSPKTQHSPRDIVPRTGLIAIFDAIIHGAAQINIVGMSFYHGGGHAFRPDVKHNSLNPHHNHLGKPSPHNSKLELQLMEQLIELFPQIKLRLMIS